MLHASTQKLIVKICELTDRGAIAWKEGKGEKPSSVFDSEGYSVEITGDPPMMRVLNADGREIERADADDLASAPWPGGGGTFATHLSAAASRAHRVARGAETAISRILSSLSAPPQKAPEPEPEPSPAAPEFDAAPVPPSTPPPVTRAADPEPPPPPPHAAPETPPPATTATPTPTPSIAPSALLPIVPPRIPALSALMRSTTPVPA